jgi:hypothetical protein
MILLLLRNFKSKLLREKLRRKQRKPRRKLLRQELSRTPTKLVVLQMHQKQLSVSFNCKDQRMLKHQLTKASPTHQTGIQLDTPGSLKLENTEINGKILII